METTIAALTEIPFFQYSSRILRRLGPSRLLAIAMVMYSLRLLLYGLMRLQDKIMLEHPSQYAFGRGNLSQEDVENATA